MDKKPVTQDDSNQDNTHLYTSSIDAFARQPNPFEKTLQEFLHFINLLLHFKDNQRKAQQNLAELQEQHAKIEAMIAQANPKMEGQKLDRLR